MSYQEAWEVEQVRQRRVDILKQLAAVLAVVALAAIHLWR